MTRRRPIPITKAPVTWILVADSRQAQVYTRNRVERLVPVSGNARRNHFEEIIAAEPTPVPGMAWHAESPRQYEVGRDQSGRVFESANAAHSMIEPRVSLQEELREHFARTISERLNKAGEEKCFTKLVLIAPAKMLGEIKKHLSAKVLKCVAAEMPKDLTHFGGEALAEHLGGIA